MGNLSLLAPHWVVKRTVLHERKVEQSLRRFQRCCRTHVVAAARQHPAVADLAVSFPALLFTLAVPHVRNVQTRHMAQVVAGVPLKTVAAQANVPLWTRRLPPEAFTQPLLYLPQDEVCSRQIVNHLPKRPKLMAPWLRNVLSAAEWGDQCFAVWAAREWGANAQRGFELRRQALWAWFSLRSSLAGHGFVTRPWTPQIKRKAAAAATREFLDRLKLHITIAEVELDPLWLTPKTVDGFTFVPLLSAQDIHEEARIMRNCIRSYGMEMALGQQRLWSMRRDGKRIATLSVGNHHDLNLLMITEIKGPGNDKVSRDVAVTAYRWFNALGVTLINVAEKQWEEFVPNRKAWIDLFKPYWMEKRRIPDWLPLVPQRHHLDFL